MEYIFNKHNFSYLPLNCGPIYDDIPFLSVLLSITCCIHQRAQCWPLVAKIEQMILCLPFFIPPLFLSPTLFLGSEIYPCDHPELFFAPMFCLILQCLLGITYVLTIFFLCIWELCFIMFFAWIAFWPPIFVFVPSEQWRTPRGKKK